MQQRVIPSTGERLPVVGCGTWLGFNEPANRRDGLEDVLRELFDAGGSVIDSSPEYGQAEDAVGDLLTRSGERSRAFIATKVWSRGHDSGIRQMNASFQKLRTETIDLMQVHNLIDWRTHLPTLRAWKDEGRYRYIGITHYTSGRHDDLEAIIRSEPIDFVQFNYAVNDRNAERRLLPLAADRGVATLINVPFGGGGLLRRLWRRELPPWAAEIGCASWAQMLLKFVLAHPAVTCVIPGTSNPAHMRDNALAGAGPPLTAAEANRIVAEIG